MGVWEYVEVAIGFLAGIGTLLVGMKMMSGGMERAADKGLRKLFSKMSVTIGLRAWAWAAPSPHWCKAPRQPPLWWSDLSTLE